MNKRIINIISFVLLFLCIKVCIAQENDHLEELIEFIGEESESDLDIDALIQNLETYKSKKLNLNTATKQDLAELKLLNVNQIDALIAHRVKAGKLISIYELQGIPFFNLATIKRITPYVNVKANLDYLNIPFKKALFSGKHFLLLRNQQVLETRKAYLKDDVDANGDSISDYLGNKQKLYLRYRYQYYTNLSYGFTAEKDEGEQFFNTYQPNGFDFYSAHFFMKNLKGIKYLAIGDYELKFGQGLTMWSGLPIRKSSYVLDTKQQGYTVKPYTSVNEFLFKRGAAISFDIKDFELTTFGSFRKLDGNIAGDDTSQFEIEYISAFYDNGFHRTENELSKKQVVNELMYGANLVLRKENFSIGTRAFYSKYSSALQRNSIPYTKFLFNGDRLLNYSFDYNVNYQNFNFYGEAAFNDSKGVGIVNGVLASLDPKFNINLFYRHFNKNYIAFYENALTEQSTANNETGIYIGANFLPSKKWDISWYYDNYKHNWLRFAADAPSKGIDYLWKIEYRPKRGSTIYLRLKKEDKYVNVSSNESNIDILEKQENTSIRFDSKIKINKHFSIKNRFEHHFFNSESKSLETGYLIYQDLLLNPFGKNYQLKFRLLYFDTDGFNSRIYAYENDVLYQFTIAGYAGTGMRYIVNARYNINRKITFWLKFDQTKFINKLSINSIDNIGSGNTEIEGNRITRLKMQLRFKI